MDLSSPTIFTDPNASNTIVQLNTTVGPMDLQLFDTAAPQTVANFLSYIQGGQYVNDVFHRLDTNPPVLQGGGFTFNPTTDTINTLTPGPDVPNEFSTTNSNVAGTIAMAKQGGNQNSASSQFFFNLADNSVTLNAANNGGFTVFGKVFTRPGSAHTQHPGRLPCSKTKPPSTAPSTCSRCRTSQERASRQARRSTTMRRSPAPRFCSKRTS